MGKTVKHTDLSEETPSPRSIVDGLPWEAIEFGGELPLVGGKLTMKATLSPGSSLGRLVAAITLASCGCACTITLFMIGVPRWAAAGALLLPAVIYLGFSGRRRL